MNSTVPDCAPRPKSFNRNFLSISVVALTILVSTLAMAPNVADPDLWGHVQFGRDVFQSGAIPETNGFSFTSNQYRWINHENLSELCLSWTVDSLGNQGLLWGKFLLSLFVIGSLICFNLRSGVGLVPTCLLTILVAWNLGYHWSFRPQLSSFICYTLLLLLLQFCFHGWRGHWALPFLNCCQRSDTTAVIDYSPYRLKFLWLAGLILFVWANSHGGYVAGLCIFIAYLGCRSLEVLATHWPDGWSLVKRLALMGIVGILATLVNPYSYRLPLWLLESLGDPRPEILDWSSSQLLSLVGFKFWALIGLVVVAVMGSKRSLDFTQCVILAVTLWQALSHFRHVPFFAIAAGFFVGPHLKSLLHRFSEEQTEWQIDSPGKKWAAALVVLLLGGLLSFRLHDRLSHLQVRRSQFPVDAFQYMSDQRLGGRLVVTYDWAQYAIGVFGVPDQLRPGQPLTRVAFDGRFRTCYPQEIVDMHFDLLFGDKTERHRSPNSGDIDPTRVLRYGSPNLVLIKRSGELSESVLEEQTEEWVLLYEDQIAQLWGHRKIYDDPSKPTYISSEQRVRSVENLDGYVEWPALPINGDVHHNQEEIERERNDHQPTRVTCIDARPATR